MSAHDSDKEVYQCCKFLPAVRYRETPAGDIIECWVACDNCQIEGFRNPLMWEAIKEWNDMLYWIDMIFKPISKVGD